MLLFVKKKEKKKEDKKKREEERTGTSGRKIVSIILMMFKTMDTHLEKIKVIYHFHDLFLNLLVLLKMLLQQQQLT